MSFSNLGTERQLAMTELNSVALTSRRSTNGLIRQYLPKTRDFTTVTGPEIRMVENRLNYRPRKCLGYLTPYEVFHNTRLNLTVALRG